MSHNVTPSMTISPAQWLALQALVCGGSITKAATEAGVARETVSRWVHHDPVFLAELQNVRAEVALQTRCALEALGLQAVGVLVEALQNQVVKPGRFRAACAVLKMIGANRAETMPATTAQEVDLRFQERDAELLERQGKLRASEVHQGRPVEIANDCEAAIAAPVPAEAESTEAGGSGEVMEQATERTGHTAAVAVAKAAHEPVGNSLDEGGNVGEDASNGKVREEVLKRFRQSVSDRVSQPARVAVRPMTMAPGPADHRSRQSESLAASNGWPEPTVITAGRQR